MTDHIKVMRQKCKKCTANTSDYFMLKHEHDLGATIKYIFQFCWKCGSFSIKPDIYTKFTMSIMNNPILILDMIKAGKLKPMSGIKYIE